MGTTTPRGRHAAELANYCNLRLEPSVDAWIRREPARAVNDEEETTEFDDAELPEYFAPKPSLRWLTR